MNNDTIQEGKSTAIISYIMVVGVLIAMSMNSENKNTFAAFHIRQALGLSILFIALGLLVSNFNDPLITISMWVFMSLLWSYGVITAIRGQMIALPLLGNFFQKMFKTL
jgi:uncharacterized membrane protein